MLVHKIGLVAIMCVKRVRVSTKVRVRVRVRVGVRVGVMGSERRRRKIREICTRTRGNLPKTKKAVSSKVTSPSVSSSSCRSGQPLSRSSRVCWEISGGVSPPPSSGRCRHRLSSCVNSLAIV